MPITSNIYTTNISFCNGVSTTRYESVKKKSPKIFLSIYAMCCLVVIVELVLPNDLFFPSLSFIHSLACSLYRLFSRFVDAVLALNQIELNIYINTNFCSAAFATKSTGNKTIRSLIQFYDLCTHSTRASACLCRWYAQVTTSTHL